MKLQKREIQTIVGGVLAVAGLWLYQTVASYAASDSGDSLGAMLVRVQAFDKLSKDLSTQARRLHLTIPVVGPAEQEAQIRATLARLAQSSGVQLGSIKSQERSSRLASSQSSLDFQLDAGGNYESALKFINALENDDTPFQVSDLRIEAGRADRGGNSGGRPSGARGGGSSGGQRNPDGNVTMDLKVRSYLFQRVIEDKNAPKPEATPRPERPSRPEATPAPTPAPTPSGEPQKEEKKATPTPTPTPEPAVETEAPRPATGVRRFTMNMGGQSMKVSVEGRTAKIVMPDGSEQTHELSDEEYAKFQDGSFKDEVTKSGGEIVEE
jgi:hypothetical protein